MNSQILEKITEQLKGIIESGNFAVDDEKTVFTNDKLSFKISHDEERKLLLLDVAGVSDSGEVGEYENASSWLFENPEDLRDAESAGLDFLDTLKGKLGIRFARTGKNGEIAMPSKEKTGNSLNIEVFCAKTLAVYPQFKDEYKAHVSRYGTFLYIDFFKTTLMPKVGEVLDENNKKNIKKLFAMLNEFYTDGDRAAQNVVVGVVLCGAVADNEARYNTALEALEEMAYLKTAFVNIVARYKKDKKLREMLKA